MKFVRLDIAGFGRLVGRTIEFGEGLTVVTGPNETGKSTIVECVLRTLFGFPERQFNDARKRYEPWSAAPYAATLRYRLDDGRTFEVTRDFAKADVPTQTVDVDTRRPVQILSGSKSASPGQDALGISLDVYRAAALVRAGDFADDTGEAARELGDRLAAIAGSAGDAKAADAVDRLKNAYREIGASGPNTPLGRAVLEAKRAEEALEKFHGDYAGFADTLRQRAALEDEVRDLTARRSRCSTALAGANLRIVRARIVAATEAQAALEAAIERRAGIAAASPAAGARKRDVELAVEAVRVSEQALADAQARAAKSEDERTALQRNLDTANAALIERRSAASRLDAAVAEHERTIEGKPLIAADVLASLEREADDVDAAESRERTRSTAAAIARQRPRPSAAAALVATIAALSGGAGGAFAHNVWLDVIGGALALAAVALFNVYRTASRARAETIGVAQRTAAQAATDFEAASAALAARCRTLGCGDVAAVRAARAAQSDMDRVRAERDATAEAATLLAQQRDTLQQRLTDFTALATDVVEARTRLEARRAAAAALFDDVGLAAGPFETRLAAYKTLIDAGEESALAQAAVANAQATMEKALAGSALASLDEEATRDAALAAAGEPGEFADGSAGELAAELARIDGALREAERRLEGCVQRIAEFDRVHPVSVAELEETAAVLGERRKRFEFARAAAKTAWETIESVKERVHRDFTPQLSEAVSRAASQITHGRYQQAWIDEKFTIRVRTPETGATPEVAALSTGTIEQFQFALRAALAKALGGGEAVPLMYDDALAHSDDGRVRAALEHAATLAGEGTQIIFFTQRSDVETLAERLEHVRIVRLGGSPE